MQINHYHNKDIDSEQWDKCIQDSINPAVYPLSWYLNITSPEWEGLISEDYSTLLPLPVYKKAGRKVIHQPEFTWQLGVYSNESLSPPVIAEFLNQIPKPYKVKSYHLNKFNLDETGSFVVKPLQTTELQLISDYAKIRTEYRPEIVDRFEKAGQNRISVVKSITNHDFIQFAYKFDRFNARRLNPSRMILLRHIVSNSIRYRMGELYGAYTRENNLCAALFLIHYKGRSILQYAVADKTGMEDGAHYIMIDHVIMTHAGKSMILSVDDPFNRNLSELFKYFGAKSYTFSRIKKKGLTGLIRASV